MPEPQGDAPQEGNKDKTNFKTAGVGAKISPSRFDQTSGHTTHKMPMNARPASPGGMGK